MGKLLKQQDQSLGIIFVLILGVVGVLLIFNTTKKEQVKKSLTDDNNILNLIRLNQ